MRNIRMLVEYDGTDFHGWQYQPDEKTIQGELQRALKSITGEDLIITGAGRTDRGVHAYGQVANFHTSSTMGMEDLLRALNATIDKAIVIKRTDEVPDDFHSRFSARSKIYSYRIIFEPSPFELRYCWFVKYKVDLSLLERVFALIMGEHDFANFSAQEENDKNALCTIKSIRLTNNNGKVIITIEADRFLRKMIRGIVGFAVDVGRGRFAVNDTAGIFQGQTTDLYFAPPQGLFLMEVKY